jgi:polar amino acid transport system ATP-binding protein
MVTHHMELAREISDRICFLEGGNILEEGPPEKIFSAPENPRTSAFLQAVFDV